MLGAAEVRYRIDVETLHRRARRRSDDLGRVHVEMTSPLVFDSYRRNRVTGSLIVIDEATNETVAAGVIRPRSRRPPPPDGGRSPNVRWQGSRMTRERRWRTLGHGRDPSGFPLRSRQVDDRRGGRGAPDRGRPSRLGDNRRHGLNGDLGFDEGAPRACGEPRMSRSWSPSRARSRSLSLVSPYAADREAAAALHAADDLHFIEVYVDARSRRVRSATRRTSRACPSGRAPPA